MTDDTWGSTPIQHRLFTWLTMVGVLTVLAVVLSLISDVPTFKGYYLFEWVVFPSSIIGYLVAVGIMTVCLLLPSSLPWWRMAIMGLGAGASASVVGGIFYFLVHGKNLTSLGVLFLAVAGALPGAVISAIYSMFLARRRLQFHCYLGAAIVAGSVITAAGSALLLLAGTWKWSRTLPEMIGRQFWLVPTVFSFVVLTALFVADRVHVHLVPPDPSSNEPRS
jgi:hypothetical protein